MVVKIIDLNGRALSGLLVHAYCLATVFNSMSFLFFVLFFPLLQLGMSVKNQNILANSVNPDETAQNEPSHQDLHCLQRYLVWSEGLKGFIYLSYYYLSN